MNKQGLALIVLIIVSAVIICSLEPAMAESNAWSTRSSMQVARSSLGAAVVNGQIYAIGGVLDPPTWIQCTNKNEKYDPQSNTWTFMSSMPTARASFGVAVYDNKIYCIGGVTGVKDGHFIASSVNEVYDPTTDSWSIKSSMPTSRVGVSASVVDGKIFLIGGNSTVNEVYDPATDTWETKASVPVKPGLSSSWSCSSIVVDKKIHVFGASPYSSSHQVYDPSTDSWSQGPPIIQGYILANAGATTGKKAPEAIYLFGVDSTWWDLGPPNFSCLQFDFVRQSWRVFSCMPTPRVNVAVAVLDDIVYVIGGSVVMIENNSHPTSIVEVYSPSGDMVTDNKVPKVTVMSPVAGSSLSNVQVSFEADEPTTTILIGVDGKNLIATNGDITLNLVLGSHNITVYAIDVYGNIGSSETINFKVIESAEFPVLFLVVICVIVVVCLLIVLFLRSRKK